MEHNQALKWTAIVPKIPFKGRCSSTNIQCQNNCCVITRFFENYGTGKTLIWFLFWQSSVTYEGGVKERQSRIKIIVARNIWVTYRREGVANDWFHCNYQLVRLKIMSKHFLIEVSSVCRKGSMMTIVYKLQQQYGTSTYFRHHHPCRTLQSQLEVLRRTYFHPVPYRNNVDVQFRFVSPINTRITAKSPLVFEIMAILWCKMNSTYLATLLKFRMLIFPESSSSNNLNAFIISSCGSRSNIISDTAKRIQLLLCWASSIPSCNVITILTLAVR